MAKISASLHLCDCLELQLQEDKSLGLLLEEFEIFLPGERKVVIHDPLTGLTTETPYTGRLFSGSSLDGTARAFLLVADEGLYGVVHHSGFEYSLQPRGHGSAGVLQEVTWVDFPASALQSRPSGVPTPPSPDAIPRYELWIKPHAEPSYTTYASDYANRITSAFGYVKTMFEEETDMTFALASIVVTTWNFGSQNICGGGVSDSGMHNFRDAWVKDRLQSGINVYTLFHAVDGVQSVAGCAKANCSGVPSGCLSNANTGANELNAVNAVQAKDWSPWDSYDPDDTNDFGKAVGHELSHNAGEPDHPSDGSICNKNLMYLANGFGCTGRWRTEQTKDRIRTYAHPRLLLY